jgi:hypothetical protein
LISIFAMMSIDIPIKTLIAIEKIIRASSEKTGKM